MRLLLGRKVGFCSCGLGPSSRPHGNISGRWQFYRPGINSSLYFLLLSSLSGGQIRILTVFIRILHQMATPNQRSEEQVSPPAHTSSTPATPTSATAQNSPSTVLPAPISTISTSSAPLSSSTSTHAPAGRVSPSHTRVVPAAVPSSTSGPTAPSVSLASNATPSSTPPKQHVPRIQPLTKSPITTKLWASRSLLFALVIVGLVDGLTMSASSANSPLGSLSNTNGILVLSILATLTGYSLSAAAQTVWD
jgi:hypothetical protein